MAKLYGKVGAKTRGYYIEAEMVDDNTITGKLGGKLEGHDLEIKISSETTELSGRFGREELEKDLKLCLNKENEDDLFLNYDVIGRISGYSNQSDVSIEGSEKEGFTGRIGDNEGYNVNLKANKERNLVTGRLGGKIKGASVEVNLEEFPVVIGVLIIALTYKLYLELA